MDGKNITPQRNKEWYTLKEAQQVLGVTYRTVRYYKEQYREHVKGTGRDTRVSSKFIEKVQYNRKSNTNRITDSKTKRQYKEELEQMELKYKKAVQEQKNIYEQRLDKFKDYDYDVENERLEVFTNEDYPKFEAALQEWKVQKVKLEEQKKSFDVAISSKEELIVHYRTQADYQKKQADRILDQMEKLIDAIKRRDTIEAVEKKVIGKKLDL
jgi:hypothetical protein